MHAPLHKLPALPSPQRSRSRRERRSDAARKPVLHVVMPGCEVARAEIKPRETISAFLRRTGWASKDRQYGWQFKKGLPTVLEVNGEPVLRKFWTTTRIAANDNVRFVSYPLGGQGSSAKQVIGLVALVAVSAFALWAGPALFGAGTFGALATTAAIGIGGSLLINALTAPKAGATNAPSATQDQIYSVSAQGNAAKLGQPLPVWYGRLKNFPDFAATPWGEFVGNDQYLNVLLSVGMGSFDYETVFVSDTPMWTAADGISLSFSTAQVEFYEPGAPVTLFPVSVVQSDEVSGQQLPDGSGTFGGQYEPPSAQTPGAWLGGFIVNASGTQVQSIAIDYVLPGGCFTVNTDSNDPNRNNIGSAIVGIGAEICPVNDAGAPIGSYSTLFQVQRSYASTGPIRDSIKVDVGDGRYLVRFRRLDAALPSQQGSNQVVWAGLRGFLKGTNTFPDVSTIAIRIKASESTQGSYKFAVLATRKLPVWNGSIFVTQATRNPGWAFLDAVSNAQYGSGLSLAKVDFNTLVTFAANCDTRGDTFDYCFTSATAVPEAFDKILTPARARHFWLGDTISVVRDEWRDVPAMLLTDREIVRDSTQVSFTMLGDEDPDAVIVEYVDQETWRPAQVQYPPDDQFFTATHAEVKRLDGIIQRDQAFREAAFYYLQSIYRRENVQIGTEYEGRAITFGSVLRVQSELPMAYGYGGAVVDRTGNALTLNPAPVWDAGPFYVRLRRPDGKWFGPVAVTQGASASIANLNAGDLATVQASQGITLDAVLLREDGGEYPSFEFGTADSQSKLCVVLNGTPNGDTCTLNLVVDDIRVHATDLGNPPILPVSQFPTNANLPLIVGLNATFGQGIAEPRLSASWFPAPGALYYIADVSFDDGASWMQVYEGQDNKFEQIVTLAALRLRVQAISAALRGPYATVDLSAPTIVIASQTVALNSMIQGIRDRITTEIDQAIANSNRLHQLAASLNAAAASRTWLDKQSLRRELSSVSGAANARITEVWTVATNTESALAQTTTELETSIGEANSRITLTNTSLSDLTQAVAGNTNYFNTQFGLTNAAISNETLARSSADSALAGQINSFSTTLNGHTATLNLVASSVNGNSVYLGLTGTIDGVTGGLILTGASVNGAVSYNLYYRGDFLVDGSVTAGKLSVGYLSAISGNIGEVIAGLIRSADNKLRIMLDSTRIEVWS
jgi:hypothetical protein